MGQLPLLSIELKTAFLYCFSEGLHKVRFSRRGIQNYAAQAIASVRLGQIPPFGVLSVATDVVHVNEVRIAKATRASSPSGSYSKVSGAMFPALEFERNVCRCLTIVFGQKQ